MKKLLSLPVNLIDSFHEIENLPRNEYYCNADPPSGQLGSGSGTIHLMTECHHHEAPQLSFEEWLSTEKRIIIHAGGQSRRLPSYAPTGKILTPLPVFRWERGQRLNQNLLSVQLPLYEDIMRKAPDNFHTLIASGDVYIRHNTPLPAIPQADVVCFGLWGDSVTATRHGVFLSSHEAPNELDYMLQKPSMESLGQLAQTHFFLMDTGLWLLSDKAISVLKKRSINKGRLQTYDLYAEYGTALGRRPQLQDAEVNSLTVKILPLTNGEFYHYGTSAELIQSTLRIQNLIHDQRAIMHHAVKPHPAMFVQNAEVNVPLQHCNHNLWIENSFISGKWSLSDNHILTGIPDNDWDMQLPSHACIDIVPITPQNTYVARPYGINDSFKGDTTDQNTSFINQPLSQWLAARKISVPPSDIHQAPLFPSAGDIHELGLLLKWMIYEPDNSHAKELWLKAPKYSAADLLNICNLKTLNQQRTLLRRRNIPALALNYRKSIFYQLDLDNVAQEYALSNLPIPEQLPAGAPIIKQIHNHILRARILRLNNMDHRPEETSAFSLLRDALIDTLPKKETPRVDIHPDQIVWSRSPVRIDLAGGWTDTPPYCLYSGGNVLNIAIELNTQTPIQVYVKPSTERTITLRSIDLGYVDTIKSYEELSMYNKVGSPFSIPKAALALAGFSPQFASTPYPTLQKQLDDIGSGLELTLLSAIPAGSGLGTSSILAATTLAALSDFCGLEWDKSEIGHRTLLLEQLLTTGGGWQDQYGGILPGLKLLQTNEGFNQSPHVRWLPETIFTEPQYHPCHLLYYTGITRTAKEILADIVRGMFLNNRRHLSILKDMKQHALQMFDTIQCGNFHEYAAMVLTTWEQNKAIDKGTNPHAIEQIINTIKDYTLGYKLPGAGGGGYLYIIAKDPQAAALIKQTLNHAPLTPNARFVDMNISRKGLQTSRS